MNKNYFEMNDTYYFHPGYYVEELIETLGLSISEFARRISMKEEDLRLLINGEQSLTEDLAFRLSGMTGSSTVLWLNYQSEYDKAIKLRTGLETA